MKLKWSPESIERFLYLFGCFVGKEVLSLADYLSQCLHSSSLSADERQEITKYAVTGLFKRKMLNALICCGIKWWSKHEATAELVMPRKKKVPSRYYSNGNEYFHSNPKLFNRQHYFDVVQRATSATINERLFGTSNFCNK